MVNRLTEFIAQTKGISTSRIIYFDQGFSYTYDEDQLVQAFTNFKEDKKGGKFFSDKTFKIQVDEFNDFVKDRKKDISDISINEENNIIFSTNIPNVNLTFKWDKNDSIKLEKIKNFFKNLNTDKSLKILDYTLTKDETTEFISEKINRMFADFDNNCISFSDKNLENYLMISIFPKYLGKLLASTKEFNLKIYNTNKDSIYLIHYTIRNMNLVSEYFGLCSDLIPLEEGGLE